MKYFTPLFLLGLFLSNSVASHGQEYTKKFYKTEFDQYLGADFVVDQESTTGWTNSVYPDFESSLSLSSDVAFQSDEYSFVTDPSRLPEGPFKVVEILDRTDNSSIRFGEARFKLLAPDGTSFWFRYTSKYEFNFPWLVGDIEIDREVVCSKITSEIDDFTGEKTFRTPFGRDAQLTKVVKGETVATYLALNARGSTLNVGERGVIILMEDGSRLEYPSEVVDSDVGKGTSWNYSAFIRMDEDALTKISNVAIDKWRLYIYDNDFDTGDAEMFKIQVGCITAMD